MYKCTIYNEIETNVGYYRQIGGLAMGSSLSGALINIFIHLMEKTVVQMMFYGFVKKIRYKKF